MPAKILRDNMADINKKVKATITAEDRATSVFRSVGTGMKNLTASATNLSGSLTKLGIVGASFWASYKIVGFFKDAMRSYGEAAAAQAQLASVLKSTAGAAGVSAEEAVKLSKALQQQSTFGDDAILSAENLLLTFTRIGKDIFPDATKIVLDMSTALGQDLKSSAIQVGKALQDPILGATALRRVGVNFSDAQQDVIKNLIETGNAAEAQKMILQELAAEFGGSAIGQMDSYAGRVKSLQNSFDDFKENIGNIFGPTLYVVTQRWNEFLSGTNDNAESWSKSMGKHFAVALEDPLRTIGDLMNRVAVGWLKLLKVFTWGKGDDAIDEKIDSLNQKFEDSAIIVGKLEEKYNNISFPEIPEYTPPDWSGFVNNADKVDKEAEKLKSSFRELSKTIIDSMQREEEAIQDLLSAQQDLDDQFRKSMMTAEERYREDVKNVARRAKEKLDILDEQIKDEENKQEAGWRTRIEKLKQEKAEEEAVIREAGIVVEDIQAEVNKSELQILKEKHYQEINQLADESARKKTEIQEEIDDRKKYVMKQQMNLLDPGYIDRAIGEKMTFLGSVGQSPTQQLLTFNFNDAVAGDEGIKKIITQTVEYLNREATLRGVAGK